MDFVHLHCYTYATRSDGWLTPRGLCHSGFGWGEQATAITDRGTLWKAPEFVLETAKQWTRAIIGSEVQVIADGEAANGCHPLVLLVENERGYANLVRILNSTQRRGGGSCPLPLAQLSEYADGLIALSGGQQSPLADMVRDNQLELAYAATIAIAAPYTPSSTAPTTTACDGTVLIGTVAATISYAVSCAVLHAGTCTTTFTTGYSRWDRRPVAAPAKSNWYYTRRKRHLY